MIELISVIGARPQFIKAAVLSRRWRDFRGLRERIVHTGQHYDENMSGILFKELDIPEPTWNLGINRASHGAMTGRMIEALEKLFWEEKPDAVIVYGDTNSTLAGALAASKLHIPVAHVEAGMRSFNRLMPEELNRVLTDHVSNFLYCPTIRAIQNLHDEGIGSRSTEKPVRTLFERPPEVVLSGDVMYEGFLYYRDELRCGAKKAEVLEVPDAFVLCTLHRQENTDELPRLRTLVGELNDLSQIIPVIIPLHPRARQFMALSGLSFSNRVLIKKTVPYLTMISLLDKCRLVVTDSGGLQKEAYFAKKPCVTLRDQTEWVETLETGWNMLCVVGRDTLPQCAEALLKHGPREADYKPDLYGSREASERICSHLLERLQEKE